MQLCPGCYSTYTHSTSNMIRLLQRATSTKHHEIHIDWQFRTANDPLLYDYYVISRIDCPKALGQVIKNPNVHFEVDDNSSMFIHEDTRLIWQWVGSDPMCLDNFITFHGNNIYGFTVGQRQFCWELINYHKGKWLVCCIPFKSSSPLYMLADRIIVFHDSFVS